MKIIDTHSHLNFKAYDTDRDKVIKRNLENGVICIDVGTKYETSKRAVELAESNKNIYAAIGMHPIHINPVRNSSPAGVISNGVKTDSLRPRLDPEDGGFAPLGEEFDAKKYKELVKSKKVVAIGEIGLDYYYKPKTTAKLELFKQKQKEVFIKQLEMAEELNLPVIVHSRMAFKDLYEILKYKKLSGTIHCFTGNWLQAQQFMDLGFYLGINGIIFKLDLNEVIKNCPLEKLLVETDCPYLTPLPAVALAKAGPDGYVRNEPIFIKHIIQKIADIKGISFSQVSEAATNNAKKLFNIY